MTGAAEQHLDLDALADVLAADGPPPAHVQTCARCAADLEALRSALGEVRADLATLPPVPPVPADLEDRFSAALAAAPGTTVLPAAAPASLEQARQRRRRVLAAAGGLAAAAVLVVGGGLLLRGGGSDSSTDATAAKSAPSGFAVSSSGSDYRSNAALQAALPALLASRKTALTDKSSTVAGAQPNTSLSRPESREPLAVLRTSNGLASCLAGLTDPSDPGLPLALDYASYKGAPALVVVLPSAKAGKVDVWVVGPGCTQQDTQLLLYLRADRPVR